MQVMKGTPVVEPVPFEPVEFTVRLETPQELASLWLYLVRNPSSTDSLVDVAEKYLDSHDNIPCACMELWEFLDEQIRELSSRGACRSGDPQGWIRKAVRGEAELE